MTFLIETAIHRYGLSVAGKLKIIENLQAPLAKIEDDFARSLYIRELAERIGGIDEAAILERVRAFAVQNRSASKSVFRFKAGKKPVKSTHPIMSAGYRTNRMERRIVSMILQFPQIIPEARCREVLQHIQDADLKAVVQLVFEHGQGSSASELAGVADNEVQRCLISSLAVEEDIWTFDGCIKLLDQFVENCTRIKDDLTLRIKTAEKNGDQDQLLQLLREKQIRAAEKLKNKRIEPAGGKTI
jgi:DNA primase